MAREIVDIAFVELDGTELETVRQLQLSKQDPAKVVKTMRKKRRALGIQRGVPEFSGSFEVVQLKEAEQDWDVLCRAKLPHLVTYQKSEGGDRRQLIDLYFTDMSEPYDVDGEQRVTVDFVYLDDKPE